MYLIVSADSPRPFGVVPASLFVHLTPELRAQLRAAVDLRGQCAARVLGVDLRIAVDVGGLAPRTEGGQKTAWQLTAEVPTLWTETHLSGNDQTGVRIEDAGLRLVVWDHAGNVRLNTAPVPLGELRAAVGVIDWRAHGCAEVRAQVQGGSTLTTHVHAPSGRQVTERDTPSGGVWWWTDMERAETRPQPPSGATFVDDHPGHDGHWRAVFGTPAHADIPEQERAAAALLDFLNRPRPQEAHEAAG